MSILEKQQHTREIMSLSLKLSEALYNGDYKSSAFLIKQGAMVEYATLTLSQSNREGMLYYLMEDVENPEKMRQWFDLLIDHVPLYPKSAPSFVPMVMTTIPDRLNALMDRGYIFSEKDYIIALNRNVACFQIINQIKAWTEIDFEEGIDDNDSMFDVSNEEDREPTHDRANILGHIFKASSLDHFLTTQNEHRTIFENCSPDYWKRLIERYSNFDRADKLIDVLLQHDFKLPLTPLKLLEKSINPNNHYSPNENLLWTRFPELLWKETYLFKYYENSEQHLDERDKKKFHMMKIMDEARHLEQDTPSLSRNAKRPRL